jgi:hypothetical protein
MAGVWSARASSCRSTNAIRRVAHLGAGFREERSHAIGNLRLRVLKMRPQLGDDLPRAHGDEDARAADAEPRAPGGRGS